MRTVPITDTTKYTPVPKEIKVISVPNFKSPSKYFKLKKEAEKIISAAVENTDVLILRSVSSCTNIALKYAQKYKKPYIFECVGCVFDALWNYSFLGKLMAPYCFWAERHRIKNSKYVYYVTNEFLQKKYPTYGKSIGCSNVVIPDPDDSVIKKRYQRIEKKSSDKKVILGTAAAIDVRYKGQEYVIKAIPELVKMGYDVEYRLAGGNRHNSTFLHDLAKKIRVADRVVFCGSLSAEEMNSFYDELDIYVQPSKQEGLPRAVIEAMSRGCPAIGTNIAGIPELIQHELLFKKGSSKAVVQAIERLLKMDLKQVAERNFDKSKEYALDVLDRKRKEFYDDFIKSEIKKESMV